MPARRRLVIIGVPDSGKSTIADYIEGDVREKRRHQDPIYRSNTVELPGKYLENHWMQRAIITTVQNQGWGLVMLVDAQSLYAVYLPGFARLFNVPVLGVITKLETLSTEVQADAQEKAEQILRNAGVTEIVQFSLSIEDDNAELKRWLARHGGSAHEERGCQ